MEYQRLATAYPERYLLMRANVAFSAMQDEGEWWRIWGYTSFAPVMWTLYQDDGGMMNLVTDESEQHTNHN
jgi:hypothetical protein